MKGNECRVDSLKSITRSGHRTMARLFHFWHRVVARAGMIGALNRSHTWSRTPMLLTHLLCPTEEESTFENYKMIIWKLAYHLLGSIFLIFVSKEMGKRSMHVNDQYDYLLKSFWCIMFLCTYKCITIVCCELVLTSFTWCSTLWALLTTFDHFAGQQFPSLGQCKVWAANAMHESKSNLNIQIMERDLFLVYPIFWSWCCRKYMEESDMIS